MSIKRNIRLLTLVSALIAGANFGCGSGSPLGGGSTNNDQGTSFLAYGYFSDVAGATGVSGLYTFLAPDNNSVVPTPAGSVIGGTLQTYPYDGRFTTLFMGLQNRLSSQYIRVTRIDCDYFVPGSDPSLVIPSDSFNTGTVIAASGIPETPIPGGPQAGVGSKGVVGFNLISTDVYSFLNVNRNRLPELPFRMIAECKAIGIGQAGDVIVTNPLATTVTMLDAQECCTGGTITTPLGGFQTGTGSGGEPLPGAAAGDQTDPTDINGTPATSADVSFG